MKKFEARKAYLVLMLVLSVFMILPGCGKGEFGGGHWNKPVSVAVSSTTPANGATVVPIGNKLTATFSEAMVPATITTTTFTLKQGATAVSGTVAYTGVTAVFTPAGALAASTVYTATITTGVRAFSGNALAANYTWSFTTGTAADITAPTVNFTTPANGATGVPTGNKLTATFSEAMDPFTITSTTFTVRQGATAVPGTVAYSGVTAVFTPAGTLAANTVYTATITTGAKDLAVPGNALASDYVWSFTTGTAVDATAPRVTATINANGATGVPINTKVGATFSEAMDPLTITTATFTLQQGATPVPGTVTYSGVNAVFTPAGNLAARTTYTATITTGARDLAGNAMASNYVWSWTTGAAPDTTAPRVTATNIANGATGVPINTKVGATFSEAMDPLTITTATFTVQQGATPVPGTVTYSGVNAVFTPAANLAATTTYTATITTGARDLDGNALASNYVWSWTTGASTDTTPPTVTLTAPLNAATGVAINSAVNATFSEAMDPSTINNLTFTVAGVSGLVTYDAITRIATFTPASNLVAGTTYTATITTGLKDLAGNALVPGVVPNPWTFTTGNGLAPGAVALGAAAPFGTFGGTAGMTNTGTLTTILGDIGTIATSTASITGFHDTSGDIYTESPADIGAVSGKIYSCTNSTTGPTSAGPNAAACAIATQARLDAQTAYLALAAMPAGANPGGNLAGLTLPPGVYTAPAGSFMIEGGDLTLDAQGNANAVWVFQMATTLRLGGPGAAAPQNIILAGGAQAKNVYWQVGSFATINAAGGGTMVGTIISQAGASFSTVGNVQIVTLNGRALSLGASVTLVDTVINVPAP